MPVAAAVTGYLGATLGVAMVVPQITRTFRDRALPGVSAMSWALTALGCMTWLLYGVRAGEIPQIPGNVLIVSGAVVLVLAVPSATSVPVRAVRLGGPALVLIGVATVLPPIAIGFLAFGIGLFSALPQTVRSLRRQRASTSAVSVLAWLLRAASQLSWLGYAILVHDLPVMIATTVVLSSALVVVASEVRPRPGRPAATTAVAAG
ncbi:MAG TPA: PQ-loop domain-containing transporter [Jatrophihabitans sp.]|nr:PQ-loop domain-containing transporter [Jatrophihabitans sp.]